MPHVHLNAPANPAAHTPARRPHIRHFFPPSPKPIDSLTTLDLGVHYDGLAGTTPAPWAQNLRVSLNVRNLTDEDPPFVRDFFGFNFDTAHGDPVGRFVSLQLTAGWGR
jgi:outer membrane receptor protein involved in Fe transport